MERRPQAGEFYRHFKDKMYQIVSVATHSETGEELVIYQALYGDYKVYARPLEMFVSEVDHAKYPEVVQKYRFEKVVFTNEPTNETAPVEEVSEVESNLIAFLDADSMREKRRILGAMQNEITDFMIETMAVSLDVVISDGPLLKRYDELKRVLATREQYEEANRLW